MTERILTTPQTTDPGTEGNIGFDYQKELAVWLCISMLEDLEIENVVCEFHEDLVQISKGLRLELIQVKQTKSKSWTLSNLIKPTKKQKKGVLGKLFWWIQIGKDVRRLAFWGYGKAGTTKEDGGLSLAKLVALLRMPEEGRDEEWELELEEYIGYLSEKLEAQGITADTVRNSIYKLDINLGFPHPDAIGNDNCNKLSEVLNSIWSIQLTTSEVRDVYQDLYARIRNISRKSNQPWNVKAISRQDVIEIILKRTRSFYPAANREAVMTTQEKLSNVGLGDKTKKALTKRLDAMVLKYEIPLSSVDWEVMKTDIDIKISEFRREKPNCKGPALWKGIVKIFSLLGQAWKEKRKDNRLGDEFVEGVFFDMTGICEARWMRGEKS